MDSRRFDMLTKSLAVAHNRRTLLKGLVGLGGAAIATVLPHTGTDAARRRPPTPQPVSCPGVQIWDGISCVCPTGVACGPDCCDTFDQCCDNACCPSGSVCVAEEQCCPVAQLCSSAPDGRCCPDGLLCCENGNGCYDPNGGCCETNDCPTEYCNPVSCENNVCVYQPLPDDTDCGDCSTCQNGNCTSSCVGNETCCPGEVCADLTNGGCCEVDDCPALACHSVTCEQHQCVYQSFANGTDCGDCAVCSDGECSYRCTGNEICCAADDTCINTENGGCCDDGDCPPDPDPCLATCSEHQCEPSNQESCTTPDGTICCPTGSACNMVANSTSGSVGICCANGTTGCFTGADLICCDSGMECVEFATYGGAPVGMCCSTGAEACRVPTTHPPYPSGICCDSGMHCSYAEAGAPGICCATPESACPTAKGIKCCPDETVCTPYSGPISRATSSACCESGVEACYVGPTVDCCTNGRSCQQLIGELGVRFDVCCQAEQLPCWSASYGGVCCSANQTCTPGMGCFS